METLLHELSRKNQEFIQIATKQLQADGKTEDEIKTIIEEVLPTIITEQKNGVPARTLLGAPTIWASQFSDKASKPDTHQEEKNTNPWLMWLNTSFYFLGILAIVNGVLANFGAQSSNQQGFLTLIAMGFIGGAAMYAIYHFVYRHAHKPKSERPGLAKTWGILSLAFIVWMLAVNVVVFLPEKINPTLDPVITILIGVASFGSGVWLKRKYNLQSTLQSSTR